MSVEKSNIKVKPSSNRNSGYLVSIIFGLVGIKSAGIIAPEVMAIIFVGNHYPFRFFHENYRSRLQG